MFDDPTDHTGLWIEEIIMEHGNAIIAVCPHLKSAVTNIKARFAKRAASIAEVIVGSGGYHGDNGGRTYGWFCVYCW